MRGRRARFEAAKQYKLALGKLQVPEHFNEVETTEKFLNENGRYVVDSVMLGAHWPGREELGATCLFFCRVHGLVHVCCST